MILRVSIGVILVVVAILLFAATRPNTFRVKRSIVIKAQPAKVFVLINDFHQWRQWAPQDRDDSTMTRNYSGADSGAGAISDWRGKGSTGSGRMEIVQSVPNSHVSVQVDFKQPFVAHNLNQFELVPEGQATRVTWTMNGTNPYTLKLMSVFLNIDRVAGKHFEAGLANLKVAAEK